MELDKKEWKPFKIADLFDVNKGIYLNKKNILEGGNPFVSAKVGNNGINSFIGNRTLFPQNTITVEKITLSAYYQPSDYYCSHDVSVLQSEVINKNNALFINSMIKRQGVKYSYGRQAQLNVVKRETLLLPTDIEGNPDWTYMEDYIIKLKEKKKREYLEFASLNVAELDYKVIKPLDKKEWERFNLSDIFSIKSGVRLTKENMTTGNTPFIGSTDSNNGITNYVSNENGSVDSNILGVNYNGSVCEVFYHPYKCIFSDDVKRLELKNITGNKYIYLFIKELIYKQKIKYTYGYKFNSNRMKRQSIMLPINSFNEPDYNYMEQYVKNLMVNKYQQYKSFQFDSIDL